MVRVKKRKTNEQKTRHTPGYFEEVGAAVWNEDYMHSFPVFFLTFCFDSVELVRRIPPVKVCEALVNKQQN